MGESPAPCDPCDTPAPTPEPTSESPAPTPEPTSETPAPTTEPTSEAPTPTPQDNGTIPGGFDSWQPATSDELNILQDLLNLNEDNDYTACIDVENYAHPRSVQITDDSDVLVKTQLVNGMNYVFQVVSEDICDSSMD